MRFSSSAGRPAGIRAIGPMGPVKPSAPMASYGKVVNAKVYWQTPAGVQFLGFVSGDGAAVRQLLQLAGVGSRCSAASGDMHTAVLLAGSGGYDQAY